jgi:hypothetical protein
VIGSIVRYQDTIPRGKQSGCSNDVGEFALLLTLDVISSRCREKIRTLISP